jgi:hypothetical protein
LRFAAFATWPITRQHSTRISLVKRMRQQHLQMLAGLIEPDVAPEQPWQVLFSIACRGQQDR